MSLIPKMGQLPLMVLPEQRVWWKKPDGKWRPIRWPEGLRRGDVLHVPYMGPEPEIMTYHWPTEP